MLQLRNFSSISQTLRGDDQSMWRGAADTRSQPPSALQLARPGPRGRSLPACQGLDFSAEEGCRQPGGGPAAPTVARA